jgi:hypothetical protein
VSHADPPKSPPPNAPRTTHEATPAAPSGSGREGVVSDARNELLDDGQEEVFSYSAVEAGQVADPRALSPDDLARAPKSPGPIPRS